MTTIAARSGVMAADSQCTGEYIGRMCKIHRLPDGTLVGGAGNAAAIYAAVVWLQGGRQGEAPDIEESCLLFLKPDHTIWLASERWPEFPLADDYAAIGSGSAAAQAAMYLGRSAASAVKVACVLDESTSEPIHTLKLAKGPQ